MWRDDLDQRIVGLQHLRDRLSGCVGCVGCGCLSLGLCKLVNPTIFLANKVRVRTTFEQPASRS